MEDNGENRKIATQTTQGISQRQMPPSGKTIFPLNYLYRAKTQGMLGRFLTKTANLFPNPTICRSSL